MTHGAFVYNNEKNALNDYKLLGSSLSSTTQEKLTQDDDELKGLSSSCTIQKNKHKMMINFLACCRIF
jgi:flagellar assembly factor FliW